jgi:hypothetical protein
MSAVSEALARIEAIIADIERLDAETGGIYRGIFADEARAARDDSARILRKMAQAQSEAAE